LHHPLSHNGHFCVQNQSTWNWSTVYIPHSCCQYGWQYHSDAAVMPCDLHSQASVLKSLSRGIRTLLLTNRIQEGCLSFLGLCNLGLTSESLGEDTQLSWTHTQSTLVIRTCL
jgi:hypothetical protein